MRRSSWTTWPPTNTSTLFPIPSCSWSARIFLILAISALFGLARESTGVAVLSTARLSNEYYGLPPSDDDLIDRLVKEGAHEVGHLLGLSHCHNRECIMFCPDTLDELNGKKKSFCESCRKQIEQRLMPQIDQI